MSRENLARYRVPPVRKSSRRTLLDQVGLRLPRVSRLIRVAILRLPVRSRLRREIFARSIRDNAEAYNRRDYEAFAIGLHPQIIIETGDAFPETTVYQGSGGLSRFLAMIEEVWSDYRIEPEYVIDLSERYVLFARHFGHGRGSGVGVNHRLGLVGTLRDGCVVRWRFFWSTSQALEAAGLRE